MALIKNIPYKEWREDDSKTDEEKELGLKILYLKS